MGISYEKAVRLFRQGEFPELIQALGSTASERLSLNSRFRVIAANALAFLGHLDEAKRLSELISVPRLAPQLGRRPSRRLHSCTGSKVMWPPHSVMLNRRFI